MGGGGGRIYVCEKSYMLHNGLITRLPTPVIPTSCQTD